MFRVIKTSSLDQEIYHKEEVYTTNDYHDAGRYVANHMYADSLYEISGTITNYVIEEFNDEHGYGVMVTYIEKNKYNPHTELVENNITKDEAIQYIKRNIDYNLAHESENKYNFYYSIVKDI